MVSINRQAVLQASPFHLGNNDLYRKWRDAKIVNYPETLAELIVEINDP